MKKSLLISLLLLLISSFSEVYAQYSTEELRSIYISLLQEHDLEGWVDEDGDVQFEYESKSYFLGVDPNDPEFFRVVMFNIWPIESNLEASQVVLALDAVNRAHKVVKGYTIDDNVWLAVELFISNPTDASDIFERSLDELESAVNTFISEM